MADRVDLVLDAKARLGEGAVWDAARQVLYWVDIEGQEVHVFDPGTGRDRGIAVGDSVGTVVPRARGGVALTLGRTFAALDLETAAISILAEPEEEKIPPRQPLQRRQVRSAWPVLGGDDGRVGVAGSGRPLPARRRPPCAPDAGRRVDLQRDRLERGRRSDVFIDTPTREVAVFDYDDATGAIANRRIAVRFPDGHGWPDGMATDAEGQLWVAEWDGGCVSCWDPESGRLVRRIELPVARVTSCAFGGSRLDELFVTTAWSRLDYAARRAQPAAGGLFRLDPGVRGTPTFTFAG